MTFFRPIDFEKWIIPIKEKLGERRFEILKILYKNPETTTKEMAEILNTTTRTIERNMAILRSFGILERIGADKVGSYKIHHIKID